MNRLINFDWSLAKQFALSESVGIEFRTDFFNIFNQPFLTAAGNEWRTLSSPQFLTYNAASNQFSCGLRSGRLASTSQSYRKPRPAL
jgi:hypothetical protein